MESIFVRVQRVVSAGIGEAVGTAERVSGHGLMRGAIREIDRTIDTVLDARAAAKSRRTQAAHQHKASLDHSAKLADDARFALGKDRVDLAEGALRRQIEVDAVGREALETQAESDAELARLDEALITLKRRKAELQEEFAAFVANAAHESQTADDDRIERTLERAEATFERAINAAGGMRATASQSDLAAKVAEIDAMRMSALVAERLAAMQADAAASKDKRAKRRAR